MELTRRNLIKNGLLGGIASFFPSPGNVKPKDVYYLNFFRNNEKAPCVVIINNHEYLDGAAYDCGGYCYDTTTHDYRPWKEVTSPIDLFTSLKETLESFHDISLNNTNTLISFERTVENEELYEYFRTNAQPYSAKYAHSNNRYLAFNRGQQLMLPHYPYYNKSFKYTDEATKLFSVTAGLHTIHEHCAINAKYEYDKNWI